MILSWEWPRGLLCSFLAQTTATIIRVDFLWVWTSDRASSVSMTEKTLYFPAFLAFPDFSGIPAHFCRTRDLGCKSECFVVNFSWSLPRLRVKFFEGMPAFFLAAEALHLFPVQSTAETFNSHPPESLFPVRTVGCFSLLWLNFESF